MQNAPPEHVQNSLGVHFYGYLGGGAFKSVFSAVAVETGEEVAVSAEMQGEQQEVENVVLARVSSVPTHPHIIGPPAHQQEVPRIIDGGMVYTVLERCERDLFDVLADSGTVAPPQAREYLVQAVAGLRFMHTNGVAHRDIKLDNIMLAHDGRLKLIDFGLAHVAFTPTPLHAPFEMVSDANVGTPSYLAPEIALRLAYDAYACDVWSLGCVLFSLVAGFFVVDRAHPSDPRFVRIRQAQAASQSTVRAIFAMYNRACPFDADLVQLLDGMLTIDPAVRWTLDQVVSCAWLSTHYRPYLALEDTYRNELLNRRRASRRWARVSGAAHSFGRGLLSMQAILDDVRFRPGHSGAQAARRQFYEDAGMLDSMPAHLPAAPETSMDDTSMAAVLYSPPGVWRSVSDFSDDDNGPPLWRSASGVGGATAALAEASHGLAEASEPVAPPPIIRQKAQLNVSYFK